MSDIVERLRSPEPVAKSQLLRSEAADEIERLKNAIDHLTADLKDDEVEIGRLRALLETANTYGANENAARIAADEELAARTCAVIVSDGGQALACSASVAAAYGTVREERDRLRAEVAELKKANDEVNAACCKEAAKVDRLRELLLEANRCLKDAKRRWAASTTNSDADVCIADIDAALKDGS